MLCERCGKNEASVHYTEIVQGEKTVYHLCETCAREKGEETYKAMAGAFVFNQLWSGLLNHDSSLPKVANTPEQQCETCGMTFSQFTKIGRFGCPDCYRTFATRMEPLLKRIQSSDQHTGKFPKRSGGRISVRRELSKLRQEMQASVVEERFEEAAKLRDRIRYLEQQLETQE